MLWTVFVAGCGGDDSTAPPVTPDSGSDARDTGSDRVVVQPDVQADRGPDVTGDATPDTTPEATPGDAGDAAPDVVADRGPDATPDVTPDVVADRGPDATPDVVADRGPDVTPDVVADRGPDATPDTGPPDVVNEPAPVVLTGITVTPNNVSIIQLRTQQYTATGTYSNNTSANITGSVTWASSNTGVATIAAGGLATATSTTGTTSISATLGGVSGSTTLTVSLAPLVSIAVTPEGDTIAPTTTKQFRADGTYANGSTQNLTNLVSWTSSIQTVATINGTTGLATGIFTGFTIISATYQGVLGQAGLNVQATTIVSIVVTPQSPSVPKGINQQFRAVATFEDASTQDITQTATWTSATPATATISATGLATSVAPGTTVISATQGGHTGTATLEVRPIELVSIVISFPGGGASASTPDGTTIQFTATGIYTDNSQANLTGPAAWDSSNLTVATISSSAGSDGKASALSVGTTVIMASYQNVQGSVVLTVNPEVLSSIQVEPTSATIAKGTDQPFTATGIYTAGTHTDLTNSVSWSSGTPATANISAAGIAHGLAVGTSNITASQSGVTSNIAVLTVTAETLVSITISSVTSGDLPDGLTRQYTALGLFTDGSTQNLTPSALWTSSNTAVANMTAAPGLATADSPGNTNITAQQDGKTSNAIALHVSAAVLQTITITPDNPAIKDGLTQAFVATGHYSDGQNINITTSVTWTSASPDKATINPTSGLAQAVDPGTSVITAAQGAISDTTILTVEVAVLSTITVAPTTPCIADGTDQQFVATGHFTDTTTVNLTGVATWQSSDTDVATISNLNPNQGLASGDITGGPATQTATISASYNNGNGLKTGSTVLSVGVCP